MIQGEAGRSGLEIRGSDILKESRVKSKESISGMSLDFERLAVFSVCLWLFDRLIPSSQINIQRRALKRDTRRVCF